ncbi:MAG: Lactoylglutathione lyase [Verrucomicrobia subdivision 3 bacterium]|nr:Lactoylglutathione lyase [Limisphaerales bacterium]MCS1415609.1 Lactoylglutathione lyase [Limisphaerales bacterium]
MKPHSLTLLDALSWHDARPYLHDDANDQDRQASQTKTVLLALRLKMTHLELNHVAIHVEDVPKSCEFYERVLKLQRIARPAFDFPGAWFRLGAHQELHLIRGRTEAVHSHNRGNHYALMVDDMDAWEAHFSSLEVEYRPRRQRPDGVIQTYVTDPDGYVIELCVPPPEVIN